jgi:hypothetical protein
LNIIPDSAEKVKSFEMASSVCRGAARADETSGTFLNFSVDI